MLSLKYIRENIDIVKESLHLKQSDIDISNLLDLDTQRRKYLLEVEQLRAEKNKVSNAISDLKKTGENVQEHIINMRLVSEKIKEVESAMKEVDNHIGAEIYFIPNIVHSSVPSGVDETANVVIKEWGEKPDFSFIPRDHLDLGEKLGLFDFKRSIKIAGSNFPLYMDYGARLERILINYMLNYQYKFLQNYYHHLQL